MKKELQEIRLLICSFPWGSSPILNFPPTGIKTQFVGHFKNSQQVEKQRKKEKPC